MILGFIMRNTYLVFSLFLKEFLKPLKFPVMRALMVYFVMLMRDF